MKLTGPGNRLHESICTLIGSGSLDFRLTIVHEIFRPLRADEFPKHLREEFIRISDMLSRINTISEEQKKQLSLDIFRIYNEHNSL